MNALFLFAILVSSAPHAALLRVPLQISGGTCGSGSAIQTIDSFGNITCITVDPLVVVTKSVSLNQNAGNYTQLTATGGWVAVQDCAFYMSVTATGLTSVKVNTTDTTPVTLLPATILANLSGGQNLTPFVAPAPLYLPTGVAIQLVIAGNGTGGTLIPTCRYYSAGGTLQ